MEESTRYTRAGHPSPSARPPCPLPLGHLAEQRGQLNREARARENGRATLARAPDRVDVAVTREAEDRRTRRHRANARDGRKGVERALLEIHDRNCGLARRELPVELLRRLRDAELEPEPPRDFVDL